ncbi:uncharacterized protein LOC111018230 [Momordica charantia]|uniref:Uncharacterized protein LOC111018230 n=1 Tax=Momordica charantia TaxID=3673 RepID=A0A6J1D838_MOMCH|nr:uncharacterized protein LOC111018230 [Momordica charantia]
MIFCKEEELVRRQASGTCPSCGGKVEAVDVERKWRLFSVPLCFKIKRKYLCVMCGRRLELNH